MCFKNNFLFVAIICLSLLSVGSSLSCQQGTKISFQSTVVNNLKERPCLVNASSYTCHRYDVTLTASGNTGKMLSILFQCFYGEYLKCNLLSIRSAFITNFNVIKKIDFCQIRNKIEQVLEK